jgi:hypothetical protein
MSGLRRFTTSGQPAPTDPPEERCEMCGTPVDARHGHVVDVEHRSIMCACRACYLLFTGENSAGGRFRAIPGRYLSDPAHPLTPPEWQRLGIPVSSAFFLRGEEGLAAFYPSPAGATRCLLDLDAWTELAGSHPMLAAPAPEVEAILVRESTVGVECYLVPIDACYELVGTVRLLWKGFDGGRQARERVEAFFAGIRARARPFEPSEEA